MLAPMLAVAAALLVLAVAVYIFTLAARERREAARSIRAREADFAIEREQHASERATLIEQIAELAGRPLFSSRPSSTASAATDPEATAWREAAVVDAGDQLVD